MSKCFCTISIDNRVYHVVLNFIHSPQEILYIIKLLGRGFIYIKTFLRGVNMKFTPTIKNILKDKHGFIFSEIRGS